MYVGNVGKKVKVNTERRKLKQYSVEFNELDVNALHRQIRQLSGKFCFFFLQFLPSFLGPEGSKVIRITSSQMVYVINTIHA